MPTTKTVQLKVPLKDPQGAVTAFQFREPKFEDFMELGDPRVPIISGDRFIFQPVPSLVKAYAERLLHNGDVNVMEMASLRDSIEIQKVVLSFFTDTDQPTKSADSDGISSSSQEKTQRESAV